VANNDRHSASAAVSNAHPWRRHPRAAKLHTFEPETPTPSPPKPAGRLSNGRFTFGNPGKPRGARHRTSREIEQLLEGAAEEVAQYIIGAARCGSLEAQKWILDRCAPARKGRAVVLDDFPEIRGPDDIAPALAAIATAVAEGVISVEEAAAALGRRVVTAADDGGG
jgi:hypothetical protein